MIGSNIYNAFLIKGTFKYVNFFGNGHINDTYLLETDTNKYIIQAINNNVFKKPSRLMKNFYLITKWLEKNEKDYRGIKLIKTVKGKKYFKKENKYYRCYEYIENCYSYNQVDDLKIVYEMGRAVGKFDKTLKKFPKRKLYKVIPNFHNSKIRYKQFKEVVKRDNYHKKNKVLREIYFIYRRKKYFQIINENIKSKKISYSVVHNDPKFNNILIDKDTKEKICIIDLDTVMPGSVLYDYGDGIRSIILDCNEDEAQYNKITINLDKFKAFSDGFIQEIGSELLPIEKELLIDSAITITLECGMRFLGDYLDDNKYFKVDDKEQNLRRARVALKEAFLLEKNKDILKKLVQ